MNKKGDENRRVRQTKELIQTTFLELMERKNYMAITVRELVEACDINRATFYYHYADIYDLLEQIEQGLIEEVVRELKKISIETYVEGQHPFITEIYKSFYKHHKVYQILLGKNGDIGFLWRLSDAMEKIGYEKWKQNYGGRTIKELAVYNHFLIGGELWLLLYAQSNMETLSYAELGHIAGEYIAYTEKELNRRF